MRDRLSFRLHLGLLARPRGFTLIELLVVIVILGILMAVAVPTFLAQQNKAQDSKTQQQLATAYKAIRSQLSSFNNQYPATASVVSAIAASEPELTVSSGSCNASTSDKQVVVDNVLTGPDKLSLYAKSGDGYWWNLTASASSAPVFTRLGTCQGPLATGTVTLSGGVITDATRAANVQGDGRTAPDSSVGSWQATTNLITNGGCESGTSYWTSYVHGSGTATLTSDSSTSKFGSASCKVVEDGGGGDELGMYHPTQTASSSTAYAYSAWVKGTAGLPMKLYIDEMDNTPAFVKADIAAFTATGSWQHITVSFTSSPTTVNLRLYLFAYGSPSAPAGTFWADGLQLEAGPVATPYVETNGAATTRASGDITIPATGLSATQGWAAVRARLGWSNASPPAPGGNTFPGLFEWASTTGSATDNILLYWNSGHWHVKYIAGGVVQADWSTQAETPAVGDEVTVIIRWTPTAIAGSFNGSAFSSRTIATPISNPMTGAVTIGRGDPGQYCDCDILWAAVGSGSLSDSDAATVNAFGDNDPTTQEFPTAAQAQAAWSADSSTYVSGN